MKTTTITLRVDENTKAQLENLSKIKGVNISKIIRESLTPHLKTEYNLNPKVARTKAGLHLMKTLAFSELIFWLYQKVIDPAISEIREFYIQHIEFINECKLYPIFNEELITELEKVEVELNKVLYEIGYGEEYFKFSGIDDNGFNYQVLADFMYTFRYDKDLEHEIIHCK